MTGRLNQIVIDAASADFLAWQPLPLEMAHAIAVAMAAGRGQPFIRPLIAAQSAPLPFYPGTELASLRFEDACSDVFTLTRAGLMLEDGEIDGTNEPIYSHNERQPPLLLAQTAALYARFFFHFVRAQGSYFKIVQNLQDIAWASGATETDLIETAAFLLPLTYLGEDTDGCMHLTTTVLFRNALFRTNIVIATRALTRKNGNEEIELGPGEIALENEVLLIENLPIIL